MYKFCFGTLYLWNVLSVNILDKWHVHAVISNCHRTIITIFSILRSASPQRPELCCRVSNWTARAATCVRCPERPRSSKLPRIRTSSKLLVMKTDTPVSWWQCLDGHLVADLPDDGPIISGSLPRYKIGDVISANCSSFHSIPAARLNWWVSLILKCHFLSEIIMQCCYLGTSMGRRPPRPCWSSIQSQKTSGAASPQCWVSGIC